MRGSLLITFDETLRDKGGNSVQVNINNQLRVLNYYRSNNLYSTFLNTGDVVNIEVTNNASLTEYIDVDRRDYTTDDTLGNMGIVDTVITGLTGGTTLTFTFTAETLNSSYGFEYRVDCGTYTAPAPTPTPTPTMTPTNTQTTTPTPTNTPTVSVTATATPTPTTTPTSTSVTPTPTSVTPTPTPTPTWDSCFAVGETFSGTNYQAVLGEQSTNKFIVGPGITGAIQRLNNNGSLDTSFTAVQGLIQNEFIVLSDDKIVGAGGPNGYNVYKFNSGGTIDNTFYSGSTVGVPTGNIDDETFVLQSTGKIIYGSSFSGYTSNTGWTQNNLVRLNTDGSVDDTFNSGQTGMTYAFNVSTITQAIVDNNDNIYLGGRQFDYYNGTQVGNIIKLQSGGTLNTGFTFFTGNTQPFVKDMGLQSDGKLIVGCEVGASSGSTVYGKLFRLNTDGTLDTSFPYNQISGDTVETINVLNDDTIIVGGKFTSYSGQSVTNFIKLTSGGTLNTTFNTNVGTGPNLTVRAVKILSDNSILIAGDFLTWNGSSAIKLQRLCPDGSFYDCSC